MSQSPPRRRPRRWWQRNRSWRRRSRRGKLIEPGKPAKTHVTASPIPDVVAAAPASDEPRRTRKPPPKVRSSAPNSASISAAPIRFAGLRALWRGLLKSRSNAPLTALRPIIVIREGSNGLGMQLRLVAGPLSDAAAAAKICAVLSENKRNCETAIFDGQRLSHDRRRSAPPPAAPSPSSRRRGAAKRRRRGRRRAAEEAGDVGYGGDLVLVRQERAIDRCITMASRISASFGTDS